MITIASFFTNNGEPQEGLSPTIKIIDISTGDLVVPGESGDVMTELNSGWYKYDFDGDETKDYAITCDGGSTLTTADRYTFAGTEIKSNLVETETLLVRILGLSQSNYRIFNPVYDSNNNMTHALIKTYLTANDANNDLNVLFSYEITATFDSKNRMTGYKSIEL